jgi:predicted Rossmann fold nucleotide-binding protein DprA/Smf involved in DNA uptake
MGVPVWVVPGDPSDELAQAGNWLLEQGAARALVRLDYFLSTLKAGFAAPKVIKKSEQLMLVGQKKVETRPELSCAQTEVLKLIEQNQGRMTVDELAEKCDTKLNALQQELLMLELMGVIHKQGTEFVVTQGTAR